MGVGTLDRCRLSRFPEARLLGSEEVRRVAIAIPAPHPTDSEKVVSSLENAALFGRIGDHEEALRWVQRAAELAGDSGDDARTLALARTAAELREAVNSGTEPVPVSTEVGVFREKKLPKAPARSRPPAPGSKEDLEEPTLLLNRPAAKSERPRPPPPSSRPLASRPPAQSTRNLPAPASQAPGSPLASSVVPSSSVATSPSSSVAPKAASVVPTAAASATPKQSEAPKPSVAPKSQPGGVMAEVATNGNAPKSSRLRPPPKPSAAPPASSSRPAPHALFASEATHSDSATPASPVAVATITRARPASSPTSAAPLAAAPRLRQAARVSVERSPTEPGLFLVRLLDDGTPPASGRSEALLVSVDPTSELF